MELDGKIAVITGSSANIGKAIALRLSELGCKVVVNSRSNVGGGEEVVDEIRKKGAEAIYVQADVAQPEQADTLFSEAVKKFGTVDILINNAGSSIPSPFFDSTKEKWLEVFDVNFFSTVLCSQRAAKIMQEKGSGAIINTSSVRGVEHTGRAGIMAYSAAKSAVNSFTKTLSKQLAPDIRVNAVIPGFVRSSAYDNVPQEVKNEFIESTVIKRWIEPEELADAYVYLLKTEAVTGQFITVDGGYTMK